MATGRKTASPRIFDSRSRRHIASAFAKAETYGLTISPILISALGVTQILAWGSSYYLLGVLGPQITADTGWSYAWVVGGLTVGMFVASMVSPAIGRRVQNYGGRSVLGGSSLLLAVGIGGIGLAQSLPVYLLAWAITGIGMGAGLYDASFATLGRLYGLNARGPITNLTLFGGFASTICWPLTALMAEHWGWRGACYAYALLHLCIALPLHLGLIPSLSAATNDPLADISTHDTRQGTKDRPRDFWLLAAIFTLAVLTASALLAHLLPILQSKGYSLASAVALGALFGPAQVFARLIEKAFGKHYHPIWTMIAGAILVCAGILTLWLAFPLAAFALIVFGAGNGITSIVRGTLPLALFGGANYAVLIGQLARPALLAQALAPSLFALLIEVGGSGLLLEVLSAVTLTNVVLVFILFRRIRTA